MSTPRDYIRQIGGSQDKGIDTFNPDIGPEITWDESTVNVSTGIRKGVGPRYGAAPLPGHADTETRSDPNLNGLRNSEGSSGRGLQDRVRIAGIVPLTLSVHDGDWPKTTRQFYAWLVGIDSDPDVIADVVLGTIFENDPGSADYKYTADIRAGLNKSSVFEDAPALETKHKTELVNLPTATTPTAADLAAILKMVPDKFWVPHSHIAVAGIRVPYFHMVGDVFPAGGNASATRAPDVSVWRYQNIYGGAPSEIITREAKDNNERNISVTCFLGGSTGEIIDIAYTVDIINDNTVAKLNYNLTIDPMYTDLTGAVKTGASTAYSSIGGALIKDPGSFTNTKHDAILLALEKPVAVVFQDWLRQNAALESRWVDLSSVGCIPRFLSQTGTFVEEASAFPVNGLAPFEDGAGTGIFRADTNYSIGIAYYNKLLNYETNVKVGVNFTTTSFNDFTSVHFNNSDASQLTPFHFTRINDDHVPAWEYGLAAPGTGNEEPRGFHINDYELRFYYKQQGASEWIPLEKFDAAEWWFRAWSTANARLGENPVASLPGGAPGGFVDYSSLPKQKYICTLTFKNRAFWFTEKSLHFSLQNNIYAYPTRNIFNIPEGICKGGILHIKRGQTEHTARLVIFGDVSYVAKFTGFKLKQSVRVSEDTVGQFDVDGSDFDIDFLSDGTAYSWRSAAVAEGDLYFWGPQGVYFDNGFDKPMNISERLESEIFDLIDTTKSDEVHSIYNKRTKEIIWFYPPKEADAEFPTHGLVYHVKSDQFYFTKFRSQIDSAQNIKIERDDTPEGISGERVLIHARETSSSTVQRTFFLDELCRSGEQGPTRELLVKTVSTPQTGQRRLVMADGHLDLSNISVGDFLAIQNAKGYAPSSNIDDQIMKVLAVNAASDYVDVALPDGATMDGITLSPPNFFPAYHRGADSAGEHGITYQIQTNYWLPGGIDISYHWQYIYMLFKYNGWPAPTINQLAFAYRTLVSGGFVEDNLTLKDNSDGHTQILHQLRNVDCSAIGQALKYRFAGVHIGHQWTLEYLEAQCIPVKGHTLKEFEG